MDASDTTQTVVKTLWTETLLEMLYIALQKKAGDADLRDLVRQLRDRKYTTSYVTEKVRTELGDAAAGRIASCAKTLR